MPNNNTPKEKNLEYLNKYSDQLTRKIEKADEKIARVNMKQKQDKKDKLAVELIIKDLEKENNGV